MTHRDGFPRFLARSAWRGDAGHRKAGAPSPSAGRAVGRGPPPSRSRRRTGSGRFDGGVGKPCRPVLRSSGAAAAEGGCPAGPAASLLPARWPDGSPARSLWVIISGPWYNSLFLMVTPAGFEPALPP